MGILSKDVMRGMWKRSTAFFWRRPVSELEREMRAHPSEFLASILFLGFGLLSLVVLALGRPGAGESLRYTLFCGSVWFLWMTYVVHYLPAKDRLMQFLRGGRSLDSGDARL